MEMSVEKVSNALDPCVIDGVKFAAYQNCMIEVWEPTGKNFPQVIRKLDEMMAVLTKDYQEGVVFVCIVAQGSVLPNGADRKALEAFFARWNTKWNAIARVAEGNDIWAVACRAMMTALRLVQRTARAEDTFATAADSAKWAAAHIARRSGASVEQTASELEEVIVKLRRLPH